MKHLHLRLALFALLFFLPGVLAANPVGSPTAGFAKGMGLIVVIAALAAEIALTSSAAIWLCRIGYRPPLVIAFALLNALSYTVFIRMIYPHTGMIFLIELLIWVVEAFGMLFITYQLSDKPLTPKQALAISFVGNLLSFLIGFGV